jgi:hypothetical protein
MLANGNGSLQLTMAGGGDLSALLLDLSGSLNEPVIEIGAGSEPIVKCLASVLIW